MSKMGKPTKKEFEEFKKGYEEWYKTLPDMSKWTKEERLTYLKSYGKIKPIGK